MEKIYKSGTNKGNRRIWIEGSVLLDMGWTRGTRLQRRFVLGVKSGAFCDRKSLVLEPATDGGHRVAGTETRPIIDLNGKYLNELFGDYTHFTAFFCQAGGYQKEHIIITPCTEAAQ